jgi:hypothetical protein
MQDLRYAFRTLVRDRGFAATAIATLALGIAVNTIAFTLLNSLALRPIPASNPDRLVRIYPVGERGERHNLFSFLDYQDYRSQASVGNFAAYIPGLNLSAMGGSRSSATRCGRAASDRARMCSACR